MLNATVGSNLTGAKAHTVELMGMQIGKEFYAISIASALTLVAGVYQVKEGLQCLNLVQKHPQLSLTTTNRYGLNSRT